MPESYVETRLNLLSALREFKAIDRSKMNVKIHDTEPLSENADRAEKQFGIGGRRCFLAARGAMTEDEVYLGVAFTSGLNKVVVPFFNRGMPVEYELARSICTVSQQKRKRIGVLDDRRQAFRRLRSADVPPHARGADDRGVEEAVRRRASQSRCADHRDVRRVVGRAAFVAGARSR